MATYERKKVSDEHTFFVCGGVIQEDQFVSLLKRIQTNLINLYPGQGFENVKWRYSITFKGLNELEDLLVDYELEDTLTKLITGLKDIQSKNLSLPGDNRAEVLSFMKGLFKEKKLINWKFESSRKYLLTQKSDIENIRHGNFDIQRLINRFTKEKDAKFFKGSSSGNIGYVWVSDPRVFDYLRMDSPFQDFSEYLNYLYYNDMAKFHEFENFYEENLKSYSNEETIDYLNNRFQKYYTKDFKFFTYEYNSQQSFHFDDLIRSKYNRCGLVLAYNYATGYVEFNKAKINLTDKINKKYLIASNPEADMNEFVDEVFRKNLIEKIGIFDVNIQFTENAIILSDKTPGKNGLVFFNSIYGRSVEELRFINGKNTKVMITKSVVKVEDSRGKIHKLEFEFVNSLNEFYKVPITQELTYEEPVVQQPGKTAKKKAKEAGKQQKNISSKSYNQTPFKGKNKVSIFDGPEETIEGVAGETD